MNVNMFKIVKDLFPICRSITGPGIQKSLKYIENIIPDFKRLKIKSGTKVFDWVIPKEWNIKDGYIYDIKNKRKFAEFKKLNLHIVNFSVPINKIINKKELFKKLYTLPAQPRLVPYVTSYYKQNWGFCVSENDKKIINKGKKFKVFINSSFKNGHLDLSHAIFKGKKNKEIFFSTYICHPSMANNELSGPALLTKVAEYIKSIKKREYTYRLVILPETIGSITYINKFRKNLTKNVICGFNLSCVGDERGYSHISSKYGNTLSDVALKSALIGKKKIKYYSFLERGSDERQYCSPGVNLPVCGFSKSKYGEYKEYHTNADNLKLVTSRGLEQSFNVIKSIIDGFEKCFIPKSKIICEPNLGKRNLYPTISHKKNYKSQNFKLDLITYSDGKMNIFEISEKTKIPLETIINEYLILNKFNILSK